MPLGWTGASAMGRGQSAADEAWARNPRAAGAYHGIFATTPDGKHEYLYYGRGVLRRESGVVLEHTVNAIRSINIYHPRLPICTASHAKTKLSGWAGAFKSTVKASTMRASRIVLCLMIVILGASHIYYGISMSLAIPLSVPSLYIKQSLALMHVVLPWRLIMIAEQLAVSTRN